MKKTTAERIEENIRRCKARLDIRSGEDFRVFLNDLTDCTPAIRSVELSRAVSPAAMGDDAHRILETQFIIKFRELKPTKDVYGT